MLLSINEFSRRNPEAFPSPNSVYTAVREHILPPGVAVRIGRKLFINEEKFAEFIDRGGASLPGGWKREVA
jgi:hypothetical protein